jgi:hypothetical protein
MTRIAAATMLGRVSAGLAGRSRRLATGRVLDAMDAV